VMPYVPGQAIAYTSYRPSLIEIMAGAAIIAYGLTAFSLGVKYLRVVDHSLVEAEHKTVKVETTETVTI
jgi:Ni/Fe-hydrogenase subunit HybB-like protein